MPSVDELLNMAEVAEATLTETNDVIEIDADTRTMIIPDTERIFGVMSDEKGERKYFRCKRFVGNGIDLSKLSLRIVFQNASGLETGRDKYIVTDLATDGEDYVTFSWELSRKVTAYKGIISFVVCAIKTNSDGTITNEWNTTLANGIVLDGLEANGTQEQEEVAKDYYNQLEAELLKVANEQKTEIEKKAQEVIGTIPSDYTQTLKDVSNLKEELTDGRTDVDGNVHKNIGDAMRGQARKLRENLVVRQKEQPTDPNNNIWISDEDDEVEVPDMGEFNSLKEDMTNLELYPKTAVYNVISSTYTNFTSSEATIVYIRFPFSCYVESVKPEIRISGKLTASIVEFNTGRIINEKPIKINKIGDFAIGAEIIIKSILTQNMAIKLCCKNGSLNAYKCISELLMLSYYGTDEKVQGYLKGYSVGGIYKLAPIKNNNATVPNRIKMAFFGDSIGEYSDVVHNNYVRLFNQIMGFDVNNLCHAGTGFSKGYNGSEKYSAYIKDITSDCNLIGVSCSFNDLDGGKQLGSWTDTTEDTILGCANLFFQRLRTAKKTSVIVCYTTSPWNNKRYGSNSVDNYINGIERLCHYYNIPFFNILNKFPFGDFNEDIQNMYYSKNGSTPDGIHPNNNGHLIIFEHIATNLLPIFTAPNNTMALIDV